MSAILEYMLQQGNEDIKEIELRQIQRQLFKKFELRIMFSPLMTIHHEKGNVLYTAGRIDWLSEEEKKLLSRFPCTDDDNVVREWLKVLGYSEIEIEKELDEIKNGPREYRDFLGKVFNYTPKQIEEEMRKLRAERKVFCGPMLIPIGYKDEELKEDEIFNNPVFRKIYSETFSIPLLEGVNVKKENKLSLTEYYLGTRFSPSECKVIKDFYFEYCEKIGFNLVYSYDKKEKITLDPLKKNSQPIEFTHLFDLQPLEIMVIVPTNSKGVDILDKLENLIGKFDPEEGEFSKEFKKRSYVVES
jgi:hypothetical protein